MNDENSAEIGIWGKFLKRVQVALTAKGVPATLIVFAICATATAIFAPPESRLGVYMFLLMIGMLLITTAANVEYRKMQWENNTEQWKAFFKANPGYFKGMNETSQQTAEDDRDLQSEKKSE